MLPGTRVTTSIRHRWLQHAGRWSALTWVVFVWAIAGCVPSQPGPTLPQFAGMYEVDRGITTLGIGWTIADANGHLSQGGGAGEVLPIDANDPNIPAILRPLVLAWNAKLDEFNADIDKVFPNQVLIRHPQSWVVRVTNAEDPNLLNDPNVANDPNMYFEGLNTPNGFVAVRGGAQVGAIGVSTITGKWDGQDKVEGDWKVSLTLGGAGPQGNGGLLTIAITIPYEAIRIPE